jgi:hypothetical protein
MGIYDSLAMACSWVGLKISSLMGGSEGVCTFGMQRFNWSFT